MSATFSITRRDLSIALTITLPAAATCVTLLAALATRPEAPQATGASPVPTMALLYPHSGSAIARDRPVIGLRYAPGAASDPLDLASFAITVDGMDRTPAFTLSATEAWGPLAGMGAEALSLGSHSIEARVCSVRGACTKIATAILVERGIRR